MFEKELLIKTSRRYRHSLEIGNQLLECKDGDGLLQNYMPKTLQRSSRMVIQTSKATDNAVASLAL